MEKNKIILFVGVPIFTNLLLIGLYFSGIQYAQQLVAPTIGWLSGNSWREFGVLEQLQNIYLLVIIIIFVIALFKRTTVFEKAFFLAGVLVMLFLLLEEIDYGIHFYSYFIGQPYMPEVANWNWHNQETAGKQNVRYLKQIVDFIMVIWFIILPLLANKITYPPLKAVIPSRWFIIGFIISIVFSRFAHLLQGMEWDMIGGVSGNLSGNISEFREATTYYLYLLYATQLFNTDFSSRT